MWLACVFVIVSLLVLSWSADKLIDGASSLAQRLGVPALLVGLTVIAFGTSAPEIFVSIMASLNGNPLLAVGNALGSNIANIALVLGIAAVIRPIQVHSAILKREYPILFAIMLLFLFLVIDLHLGRWDGLILAVTFLALMIWIVKTGRKKIKDEPMQEEFRKELKVHLSLSKSIFYIALGIILLPLSSFYLVENASFIARGLGVSDLVIGLTIVAVGTSLPEVATSIAGSLKNEDDIVIGNVLGSNMFNIAAVLIFPGLIHPSALPSHILTRDMATMFFMTALLFLFSYGFKGMGEFGRIKGFILLIFYGVYIASLALTGLN